MSMLFLPQSVVWRACFPASRGAQVQARRGVTVSGVVRMCLAGGAVINQDQHAPDCKADESEPTHPRGGPVRQQARQPKRHESTSEKLDRNSAGRAAASVNKHVLLPGMQPRVPGRDHKHHMYSEQDQAQPVHQFEPAPALVTPEPVQCDERDRDPEHAQPGKHKCGEPAFDKAYLRSFSSGLCTGPVHMVDLICHLPPAPNPGSIAQVGFRTPNAKRVHRTRTGGYCESDPPSDRASRTGYARRTSSGAPRKNQTASSNGRATL